ncbi:hypothetical protein ETAA8_08890 [Anatilimnocola aggregata]|uniref:Uncharacterized protein n=1 Tax=Anatilimnocola aggregata TaxID=2528021 RepID=A0A517Y6G1_9BACT|nr:hypothetical protein [Anatilimnocola aggregata]QDU25817.1 hypothetical protein ETAA8_08890 [Anatilimnocola aggregata]
MCRETHVVVFRKWRNTGTIIALLPELPSEKNGWYCDSYEQIGQHGGADCHGVIQHTTPASAEVCAGLAIELTGIGYNLKPIKRSSCRHHERRRATVKMLR